jgi:hypothetical protein
MLEKLQDISGETLVRYSPQKDNLHNIIHDKQVVKTNRKKTSKINLIKICFTQI